MSRVRSPNYPSISLPSAVEKVRAIQKAEGKNSIARESIAKILGFSGLHGASATALSAISKYGLIEASEDGEARVSDLAMRILYPEDESERQAALEDAALRPVLFKEVREKWPERPPSDDNLRSFLVRKGFAQGALDQVIQIYRDTIDMVGAKSAVYEAPQPKEGAPMQQNQEPVAPVSPPQAPLQTSTLPPGRPFSVAFDGSVLTGVISIRSVKDIDRLMKVLSAQKAAFEAMKEDEETELPGKE